MPLPEPRFARLADRVEPIGSALALTLLLASWIVGYVTLVPADAGLHRAVATRTAGLPAPIVPRRPA